MKTEYIIVRAEKIIISLIIVLGFSFSSLKADINRLAIGIGYPYPCLKYDLSARFSPEFRYAAAEGIRVMALRMDYRFYNNYFCTFNAFCGLEAGYIVFDTLGIEGKGYEASLVLGSQYFILNNLSMVLDLAPVYIGLEDNDFKLNVAGIEWVTSLMIYYHF